MFRITALKRGRIILEKKREYYQIRLVPDRSLPIWHSCKQLRSTNPPEGGFRFGKKDLAS